MKTSSIDTCELVSVVKLSSMTLCRFLLGASLSLKVRAERTRPDLGDGVRFKRHWEKGWISENEADYLSRE